MKVIKVVVAVGVSVGLIGPLHAQSPDVYNSPAFQPPLPPSSVQYRSFGRIWVEKGMDKDGYKLLIYISDDIDPEAIQVRVAGRTIIIENKQSFQQEERSDRGFYSYSRSTTNFRRRFSIPRDADAGRMQRTENNGVITITLPFVYASQEDQ